MSKPTLKIEVMESTMIRDSNGEKYIALCIDDIRHGPDAGPWAVVQSISVDAAELKSAADKALDNG